MCRCSTVRPHVSHSPLTVFETWQRLVISGLLAFRCGAGPLRYIELDALYGLWVDLGRTRASGAVQGDRPTIWFFGWISRRTDPSQSERLGDQFIGPAPVGVVVSNGYHHGFFGSIRFGHGFDSLADGCGRADNGAARASRRVRVRAAFGQKLKRLLDRRDRNQLAAVEERSGHSGAGGDALGFVIGFGADGPGGHDHARFSKRGGGLKLFTIHGGVTGAFGIDEIGKRVGKAGFGGPDGALRRRSQQPDFGDMRTSR